MQRQHLRQFVWIKKARSNSEIVRLGSPSVLFVSKSSSSKLGKRNIQAIQVALQVRLTETQRSKEARRRSAEVLGADFWRDPVVGQDYAGTGALNATSPREGIIPIQRHRLRFGVRSVLVITAMMAVAFSMLAHSSRDYRKRLRIESDLRSMGAYYVAFDESSNPVWVSLESPVDMSQLAAYKPITNIDVSGSHITDASVRHIAQFESLKVLDLSRSDITDDQMKLLSTIDSLEILLLGGTHLTDASLPAISQIDGLVGVDLSGTDVTDDAVKMLEDWRPEITVRRQ